MTVLAIQFDAVIPVWGLIVLAVPFITWIIVMIFTHKSKISSLEASRKEMKTELSSQEKSITSFKKEIEDKLDKHKISTDSKLNEINTNMVATKTLVELLVANRIKTGP